MGKIIVVSGKGGTGKTTFSGLLVKNLADQTKKSILAIDADPNSNLPQVLGVNVNSSIGSVLEELKEKINKGENLPAGMNKTDYLKYQLETIIEESEGFDTLVLGRPEGPGCYCSANNMLRECIKILTKQYDYIVIDSAAGLEHFSRKVMQDIDVLIIMSDPSKRGVDTANAIWNLIKDLKLKVKKVYIVINRLTSEISKDELKKLLVNSDLNLLGFLPEDDKVRKYDFEGKALVYLSKDSEYLNKLLKLLPEIS